MSGHDKRRRAIGRRALQTTRLVCCASPAGPAGARPHQRKWTGVQSSKWNFETATNRRAPWLLRVSSFNFRVASAFERFEFCQREPNLFKSGGFLRQKFSGFKQRFEPCEFLFQVFFAQCPRASLRYVHVRLGHAAQWCDFVGHIFPYRLAVSVGSAEVKIHGGCPSRNWRSTFNKPV